MSRATTLRPKLGRRISTFAPDLFIPFNLDINSVAVKGTAGFAGLQGKLIFTDTTFTGVLH